MVSLLVFPQCVLIFTNFVTDGTDGVSHLGSVTDLQVLRDVSLAMCGLVRAAWAAVHLETLIVNILIHFKLKILFVSISPNGLACAWVVVGVVTLFPILAIVVS